MLRPHKDGHLLPGWWFCTPPESGPDSLHGGYAREQRQGSVP